MDFLSLRSRICRSVHNMYIHRLCVYNPKVLALASPVKFTWVWTSLSLPSLDSNTSFSPQDSLVLVIVDKG